MEIPYGGGKEEESQSNPVIEEPGSPTQTGSYVESMTPCASPQSRIIVEDLSKSIIVSQGVQSSSNQNSGSSMQSQNQSPPTSPRGGNTKNNMVGIYNTLRIPKFKGVGSQDLKHHLFVYETIWAAKNIQYDVIKIVQLAMKFRGRALVWYMKLQSITPTRQARNLGEIKQVLLKEFKNPNSESQ